MKTPLQGIRVLNTRPATMAKELSAKIHRLGGIAIECPTIEIQPTSTDWLQALPDLNQVHHAIFISANAVHYCFKTLQQHHIQWPKAIQTIAIGHSSAEALAECHIQVHGIPALFDSEHILEIPSLHEVKNDTILLIKGEGGRMLIENTLLQRGAHVIGLDVYKRLMPKISRKFINSLWQEDAVDIILLTSEQSIHNLFKIFHKNTHLWLQDKPCVVISDRLAKSASNFGIKKIIMSHPNTIVNTLLDYYQGSIYDQ